MTNRPGAPTASAVVTGHAGLGDPVQGVALVAKDGFSARYDLDRMTGLFSRPSHALYGQSYVGKILVLDKAKGGVASAWMLHEMVAEAKAPLALVLNHVNPVIAQGAALAGLTLMDGFEDDITSLIRSGEVLEIDPETRCLRVSPAIA